NKKSLGRKISSNRNHSHSSDCNACRYDCRENDAPSRIGSCHRTWPRMRRAEAECAQKSERPSRKDWLHYKMGGAEKFRSAIRCRCPFNRSGEECPYYSDACRRFTRECTRNSKSEGHGPG